MLSDAQFDALTKIIVASCRNAVQEFCKSIPSPELEPNPKYIPEAIRITNALIKRDFEVASWVLEDCEGVMNTNIDGDWSNEFDLFYNLTEAYKKRDIDAFKNAYSEYEHIKRIHPSLYVLLLQLQQSL
jgi:hypothetical protein